MNNHQTAIVTGAGQGIGLEICLQLAAEGINVILNDQVEPLAVKAGELVSKKGNCRVVPGDASQISVIDKLILEAVNGFGSVNIVVANAGITLFNDFLNYTEEEFWKVMQLNLGGTFFLTQRAARQMIAQGGGGKILLMSSVTGHQAHKNLAAYSMTKAAIEMLAKNLVIELSPHGININAIAPGATMTERTSLDSSYEATWSGLTPMGRPASVSDIANAATFLVSSKANQITGQTLIIDGGWSSVSPSPYE